MSTRGAARAPRHAPPPGACNCHFHVSDGPSPLVAERSYTPCDTPMADYLAMRDILGLSRGVLVQSSTHGTDNRTLVAALRADPCLRGIAVVDQDSPPVALRARLGEWLQNADVRKALSLAIDRDIIVQNVLAGGQKPAYTFTHWATAVR